VAAVSRDAHEFAARFGLTLTLSEIYFSTPWRRFASKSPPGMMLQLLASVVMGKKAAFV
jgi:hypothetical protein